MGRIPNIYEQVFEASDTISGVAYTGTADPVQSDEGHVYRQSKDPADAVIDGGEIPSEETGGAGLYRKVASVYVFASDATLIQVVVVDVDGYEFVVYEETSNECLIVPLHNSYPLLPGWKAKVVVETSNPGDALGADGGKIMFVLDTWFQPAGFNFA